MSAVILGLAAALFWGSADVLSRYTGRALGADGALMAMMAAGVGGMSLWVLVSGQPWPGLPGPWTLAAAGLAAVNMLMFYEAMRRGPVSLVSPAVSAYPAWAVLLNVALGVVPSPGIFAAMAVTIGGVLIVARFAAAEPDPDEAPDRRATFALAMAASLMFAVTLLLSQRAIAADGLVTVVWWGRLVGMATMVPLVLARPRPAAASPRNWGVALLQGGLDTTGLVFLFAAGSELDGALASVASSAFGVVTVLFARLLYRERITALQGVGILAVTAGVVTLAALS